MHKLTTRLLLTILTILSGIGTTIAFNACNELRELNENMVAVTLSSKINTESLEKMDKKIQVIESSMVTTNLDNRDRMSKIEKNIALVERWCRKWKLEFDQHLSR